MEESDAELSVLWRILRAVLVDVTGVGTAEPKKETRDSLLFVLTEAKEDWLE